CSPAKRPCGRRPGHFDRFDGFPDVVDDREFGSGNPSRHARITEKQRESGAYDTKTLSSRATGGPSATPGKPVSKEGQFCLPAVLQQFCGPLRSGWQRRDSKLSAPRVNTDAGEHAVRFMSSPTLNFFVSASPQQQG